MFPYQNEFTDIHVNLANVVRKVCVCKCIFTSPTKRPINYKLMHPEIFDKQYPANTAYALSYSALPIEQT